MESDPSCIFDCKQNLLWKWSVCEQEEPRMVHFVHFSLSLYIYVKFCHQKVIVRIIYFDNNSNNNIKKIFNKYNDFKLINYINMLIEKNKKKVL